MSLFAPVRTVTSAAHFVTSAFSQRTLSCFGRHSSPLTWSLKTDPLYRNCSSLRTMPSTTMEKPNVVFVLGGPGAGKGTQCAKMVQHFKHVHLSAGDLLREERSKAGSQFGDLIEHHLREGSIVPVAITCALIHRAMDESQSNNFLIDGFPRNKDNLTGWAKEMGDKTNVRFVLFFECSQETCLKRCLKRGAEGSGRSDDNAETLQKRFVTYMEKTMPIVEHYRKLGLVKDLDANGNEEEVFDEVKKIFAEMDTK